MATRFLFFLRVCFEVHSLEVFFGRERERERVMHSMQMCEIHSEIVGSAVLGGHDEEQSYKAIVILKEKELNQKRRLRISNFFS